MQRIGPGRQSLVQDAVGADAVDAHAKFAHLVNIEFFRDLLKRAKKGRDWWIGFADAQFFGDLAWSPDGRTLVVNTSTNAWLFVDTEGNWIRRAGAVGLVVTGLLEVGSELGEPNLTG